MARHLGQELADGADEQEERVRPVGPKAGQGKESGEGQCHTGESAGSPKRALALAALLL